MESVDSLAENECVIRLGHHSNFDAMTIHGELRQPPSRYRGHIRWFASGIVPLGWAKLTFRPAP